MLWRDTRQNEPSTHREEELARTDASRVPEAALFLHHARDRSHFSSPAGSSWPQQLSVEGQARAVFWECSGFSFTLTSKVASPWLPNLSKGRFLEEESGNDGWS